MTAYAANLIENAIFWRNHNRDREYVVVEHRFSKDNQSLYVITKSTYVWRGEEMVLVADLSEEEIRNYNIDYQLGQIIYEDNLFVHKRVAIGFMPKEYLYKIFDDYTNKYT